MSILSRILKQAADYEQQDLGDGFSTPGASAQGDWRPAPDPAARSFHNWMFGGSQGAYGPPPAYRAAPPGPQAPPRDAISLYNGGEQRNVSQHGAAPAFAQAPGERINRLTGLPFGYIPYGTQPAEPQMNPEQRYWQAYEAYHNPATSDEQYGQADRAMQMAMADAKRNQEQYFGAVDNDRMRSMKVMHPEAYAQQEQRYQQQYGGPQAIRIGRDLALRSQALDQPPMSRPQQLQAARGVASLPMRQPGIVRVPMSSRPQPVGMPQPYYGAGGGFASPHRR